MWRGTIKMKRLATDVEWLQVKAAAIGGT